MIREDLSLCRSTQIKRNTKQLKYHFHFLLHFLLQGDHRDLPIPRSGWQIAIRSLRCLADIICTELGQFKCGAETDEVVEEFC
jgi:hypothetical protein